jgi:hypothetical protein
VEQIAPSRLLTEMSRPQLVAKRVDPSPVREQKVQQPEAPAFKPESIPAPLTDVLQLQDRRAMLRQQLHSWQK